MNDLPKMRTIQFGQNGSQIHLGVLRKSDRDEALNFFDAHRLVGGTNAKHGTHLRVIGPSLADKVLTEGPRGQEFLAREGCTFFLTSMLISYPEPGKGLEYGVVASYDADRDLAVFPSGTVGRKNSALVVWGVSSDNLKGEEGNPIIAVPVKNLKYVLNFPQKCGWYVQDANALLPYGEYLGSMMPDAPEARYLWRSDSSYSGPVMRELNEAEPNRAKAVVASAGMEMKAGIVVKIPADEVARFSVQ